MLTIEAAQDRILDGIEPLGKEVVPLAQARGRVMASEVRASMNIPPVDNSAMDGFAVRWEDVRDVHHGGSEVVLEIVETVAAGAWPTGSLGAGQAAGVMTGAPIPPGADLVIMREWTRS